MCIDCPFGVVRVSASWPTNPMRVMRFLQSMFCLPFLPRSVGATRSEGGRSQAKRNSFSEGQEHIVCALEKAMPAMCEGNRNPHGLELLSMGAERGNYLEAKPKREGQKGRPACNDARSRTGHESRECGSVLYSIELHHHRENWKAGNGTKTRQRCGASCATESQFGTSGTVAESVLDLLPKSI